MRYEEQGYQPVVELVGRAKDWALLQPLEGVKPQTRLSRLKAVFLLACARRDDEYALELFGFLMRAVDDVHCLPFTKEGRDGRLVLKRLSKDEDKKRWEHARDKAARTRAQLVKRLYPDLPVSEPTFVRVHLDQDESTLEPSKKPTLLHTREAMLKEIAHRWAATRDEDEADELFTFLLELSMYWKEEKEKRLAAIKAATDRSFPSTRLARYSPMLIPRGSRSFRRQHDDVAGLLVAAWARARHGIERVASDILITEPLVGGTPGCLAYVEQLTREVAQVDAWVRELLAQLKPNNYSPGNSRVRGDLTVTYRGLRHIQLLIELKEVHASWGDENWHEQFELAKERVEAWQRGHDVVVTLRLEGQRRYSGELDFEREAALAV